MSFVGESRTCWKMKGYNAEKSCTEILQYFGILFIILHPRNWNIGCSLSPCFSLAKTVVQVNSMKYLWVEKISLTKNAHVIMQKYFRYWLRNFTLNNALVVSPFLWRLLQLSTLIYLNFQPYLCNNIIIVY